MKNIVLIALILLLSSCNTNKSKKQLIGNWYNLNKEYTDKFQFKKDSVIIIDTDLHKSKYKIVNNRIEFNYKPRFGDSKILQLSYQLSSNGDTLKIKSEKDSIPKNLFLKAKSYLDFLFKKNNVTIDLESNQSAEHIPLGSLVVNIYIENKNGVFKGKTEFSENLEYLDEDLEKLNTIFNEHLNREYDRYSNEVLTYFKHSPIPKTPNYKKKWMKQYFNFQIFADKSIPQNEIDKIVLTLKENYEFRIYQIYFTPENIYAPINFLKGIKK